MSTWLDRIFAKWLGDEDIERPEDQRWGRICPHCKAPSIIRSSHQVTPQYSEQLRYCQNPNCGHVWIDSVAAVRTLSPPAQPDPSVHIPLSKHIKRESVASLMKQPEQTSFFGEPK